MTGIHLNGDAWIVVAILALVVVLAAAGRVGSK